MERITTQPRDSWQQKVEQLGFSFHTDDIPYWNESAYYKFSQKEIDAIKDATDELWEMCWKTVEFIVKNSTYKRFNIPEFFIPFIEKSWFECWPFIYGRFDLAYRDGEIKMLEFNADTPTSLFESSVVQHQWLHDFKKKGKQFNGIEQELVNVWDKVRSNFFGEPVYFSCIKNIPEDFVTTSYIQACAEGAGVPTRFIYLHEIGWSRKKKIFLDLSNNAIENIFKLYPYEWILTSDFASNIVNDAKMSRWIEPPWKILLSNKAILPFLWEMYPGHPLLLPAYYKDGLLKDYARKPFFSRQGENIELVKDDKVIDKTKDINSMGGFIYQKLFELPKFDDYYAVIGSWIIGEVAAGMGVRESVNLITDKKSCFVPHLIS